MFIYVGSSHLLQRCITRTCMQRYHSSQIPLLVSVELLGTGNIAVDFSRNKTGPYT